MKMPIELKLEYKGARTYLQGGDLFDQSNSALHQHFGGHILRLNFRRFAYNQCDIHFTSEIPKAMICAEGVFCCEDGSHLKFLLSETLRPVTGRYAFDEESLVAGVNVNLGTRSAHFPLRSNRSPIEEAIALTKLLNYKLMPNIPGQWVLGQVSLKQDLPVNYQSLGIRMVSSIQDRFSINEINCDEHIVGHLHFVVGRP